MSGLGLKKLAVNAAATLGRQVSSGLLQIITLAVIGRFFGAEGTGIYTLALLLPTMLATFLNIGIGSANVYYIGSNQVGAAQAWSATKKINTFIIIAGLLLGSLIVHFGKEKWFSGVSTNLLWFSLFFFPLVLITGMISSFFQALQEFKRFNVVLLLQPLLNLILIVVLIVFNVENIYLVFSCYFISLIVTQLIAYINLKPLISNSLLKPSDNYIRRLISYGYKAHLSDILAFLNYRSDIILISYFLGAASVGIYSVAISLVEKLWLFSQGISTVLLPRLSQLHDSDDKRNIITPMIARGVLWLTLFFAIILALIGSIIIKLLFGESFLQAYTVILILLPGIVLGACSRILANDMAARGKPELNLATSWITVIINISLNFYLIPKYGVEGAACATSIAYTVNTVMRLAMHSYFTKVEFHKNIFLQKEDLLMIKEITKGLYLKLIK